MRVCILTPSRLMEADSGLVLVYGLLFVFWMVVWHVVRMYVISPGRSCMFADLILDRSLVDNLSYFQQPSNFSHDE